MRALVVVAALALGGCASRATIPSLVDAHQAGAGPTATSARALAPQAVDEADALVKLADKARSDGDDVTAALYAERALAGYQRAAMLARVARATLDLGQATSDGQRSDSEHRALVTQRAEADRQGAELEKRLFLAREERTPAPSGPADPKREAARLAASRSLALGARLLCGAARLLDSQTEGLTAQESKLAALEKGLDPAPKVAPIDDASRVRAECLALLTKARRAHPIATGGSQAADALLAELSAAGSEPFRDERGVVVSLHDAFAAGALAKGTDDKLMTLGRVAVAHPTTAVQVVVHDASSQPAGQRAQLVSASFAAAGLKADKLAVVLGGTLAPLVDPADQKNRSRNARVDVVFVTGD